MLATDLIIDVRASRRISAEQVDRLERMIFETGAPGGDQLRLLFLIDSYLQQREPRWIDLLTRASMAALLTPGEEAGIPLRRAKAA
jgi:hypothetical protein